MSKIRVNDAGRFFFMFHFFKLICFFCLPIFIVNASLFAAKRNVTWPIADDSFMQNKPIEDFIQATASGDATSGLYGNTRNNGARFHEGIDIKAQKRDSKGRPMDVVFSILPGMVAYANSDPSKSSYGRYVVVEHIDEDVAVYSLYAHLSSIDPNTKRGVMLASGSPIGIMGNSSTTGIPLSRAHVHLEIGLRLTDRFQSWYDKQKFGIPNDHGVWNGMNVCGFDPLEFYKYVRSGKGGDMSAYIHSLPVAITIRVDTQIIPDLARRYPRLLEKPIPSSGVGAWEMKFTRFGFPVSLSPVERILDQKNDKFSVSIIDCEKELVTSHGGRNLVDQGKQGLRIGNDMKQSLELIFGVTIK
jgi:peptidoglycan LD-endopeptidase LytH